MQLSVYARERARRGGLTRDATGPGDGCPASDVSPPRRAPRGLARHRLVGTRGGARPESVLPPPGARSTMRGGRAGRMHTLGVDAPKRVHEAVALDPAGREAGRRRVPNTAAGWRDLRAWATGLGGEDAPRRWGIEGAWGYGRGPQECAEARQERRPGCGGGGPAGAAGRGRAPRGGARGRDGRARPADHRA